MTASASIREVFYDLKKTLSPSSREYLERLADRPDVAKVLRLDESEQVAARAAKAKTIAATWTKFERPLEAAVKRRESIAKRERELEQQLREAVAERQAAASECLAMQCQRDNTISRIEMELRDEADSRLGDVMELLNDLRSNKIRHTIRTELVNDLGNGAKLVAVTNAPQGAVAMGAVSTALAACEEMKLQALTTDEVEARLAALFESLREPLDAINLHAPMIKDGRVEAGRSNFAGNTSEAAQ